MLPLPIEFDFNWVNYIFNNKFVEITRANALSLNVKVILWIEITTSALSHEVQWATLKSIFKFRFQWKYSLQSYPITPDGHVIPWFYYLCTQWMDWSLNVIWVVNYILRGSFILQHFAPCITLGTFPLKSFTTSMVRHLNPAEGMGGLWVCLTK